MQKCYSFIVRLLGAVVLCMQALSGNAGPSDQWALKHSSLESSWAQVAYVGGQFVAVGEGGSIATSADGSVWTARDSGGSYSLNGIAYGNGTFVIAGDGGLLTSTNGVEWRHNDAVYDFFTGVAFGNGIFVATGSTMHISTDGQTWITAFGPFVEHPVAHNENLSFQNGMFVFADEQYFYASTDGIHWSEPQELSPKFISFNSFAYGNGIWVATGSEDRSTSLDGVHWNPQARVYPFNLLKVVYGQNIFVAVGDNSRGGAGIVFTSSDGLQWTQQATNTPLAGLSSVAYGNGVFVAAGRGGVAYTSSDGRMWTASEGVKTPGLSSITEGGGKIVAVGGASSSGGRSASVFTSTNNEAWTERELGAFEWLVKVIYGKGRFVAIGNGSILNSADGEDWNLARLWPQSTLENVNFVNDAFFVSGSGGSLLRSPDGVDWTLLATGTQDEIRAVAFGHGRYVAVGGFLSTLNNSSRNFILTSTNGIEWMMESQLPGNQLRGVAFGNGRFVAVRWIGTVVTSTDGLNWTEYHTPMDQKSGPPEILFSRGYFITPDSATGHIWTSLDGIEWTASMAPVGRYADGTFYAFVNSLGIIGDRVAAASASGVIWESGPLRMPYAVEVASEPDSFRIDRSSRTASLFQAELQVPYSVTITNEDGTTLNQTNIALIPEGQSTVRIDIAPRQFSQAEITISGGDNFEVGSTNQATISLPDGGLAPRFRRDGIKLISSNSIKVTVDARLETKVQIEESSDMTRWTPAGTYTNTTGAIEITLPVKADEARHFYRARVVE